MGTGAQALLTAARLIGKLPFKGAWSDFTSELPMLQAMAAGSVDVGGVGNVPPVFAAVGGDQIAIVGALQASPRGSALLVPKGSPIHPVAQLRGKRIAVAQGSSADYHLLTVLNKAGIGVHYVTLVYMQAAVGLAALTSCHVGAWDICSRSRAPGWQAHRRLCRSRSASDRPATDPEMITVRSVTAPRSARRAFLVPASGPRRRISSGVLEADKDKLMEGRPVSDSGRSLTIAPGMRSAAAAIRLGAWPAAARSEGRGACPSRGVPRP